MSRDHVSIDGSLVNVWASMKSVQPQVKLAPNAEVDFRGERLSNAPHASMTDSEARLFKTPSGAGAMICFVGEMRPQKQRFCSIEWAKPRLMGKRSGQIVQADLTQADGHAERRAARRPLRHGV